MAGKQPLDCLLRAESRHGRDDVFSQALVWYHFRNLIWPGTSMVFPEEQLWTEINDGWSRMSFSQRNLWAAIKRPPERWELNGYGPCWVVAILGETVIYYNHFEHGFNCSPWSQFGAIEQFHSLQSSLGDAVQAQLNLITTGYDSGPRESGPTAGEYPDQ